MKLDEQSKITLTVGQLKRLVKESMVPDTLDDVLCRICDWLCMNNKFTPVEVKRGRKFKGFGYFISSETKSFGYVNSGVKPRIYYVVNKVWNPAKKGIDYFNTDEYEELPFTDVNDEKMQEDFRAYFNPIIDMAKSRCGVDEQYMRNYIRKVSGLDDFNLLCNLVRKIIFMP